MLSITAVILLSAATTVQAEDFFSALFGSITGNRPPPTFRNPFESFPGGPPPDEQAPPRPSRGGGQAYCVRTCDGRYFPLSGSDVQSRTASCTDLCPASETRVVYGSTIARATTEQGKPYSELPNAFRYRKELVAGCTCNGSSPLGLAAIKTESDPTLRRGDIIAGANGLMIADGGADRRGAALNMTPVSPSVRARYERTGSEYQE